MRSTTLPIILILFTLVLLSGGRLHGEDFQWKPITPDIWKIQADSAPGYQDAIMLFERVESDDDNMANGECFVTVYDRIRILSAKGRSYADVKISYDDDNEDVQEIAGRTVLPNGGEVTLAENQVHEEEAVKGEDYTIKQKAFSLPGVTENCIIEYRYRIRRKYPNNVWNVQKDIPLLSGEYNWKFFRMEAAETLPGLVQQQVFMSKYLTPNYTWVNTKKPGTVTLDPPEKPEQVTFSISDVPPMIVEPNMIAPAAARIKLLVYYGNSNVADQYWNSRAEEYQKAIDKYCEDDERLKDELPRFMGLPTDSEKIQAVYHWIQTEFENTSYRSKENAQKEYDKNDNVNDIVKHRYGSLYQLNLLFHRVLCKLGIAARMAYCVNRDQTLFIKGAKYDQFEGSLVAVGTSPGYRFYGPGWRFLPPGVLPRIAEGTEAFVVTTGAAEFIQLGFSDASRNRIERTYRLALTADGSMAGHTTEKSHGQPARSLRLQLYNVSGEDLTKKLEEQITDLFEKAEADSVMVEDINGAEQPITLNGNIQFSGVAQNAGQRILVQPYAGMAVHDNPFQADDRHYSILFDYPMTTIEQMTIALPPGYRVEGVPSDTAFSNSIGRCSRTCVATDSLLTITKIFALQHSSLTISGYPKVQELFQQLVQLDRTSVVLTSSPPVQAIKPQQVTSDGKDDPTASAHDAGKQKLSKKKKKAGQ